MGLESVEYRGVVGAISSTEYAYSRPFATYAIFTGGAQILQLVYPNELFPTEIRGGAVGLATSLSRVGGAVGTYMVLIALDRWGIGTTMLGAAAIAVTGLAVSAAWAPETRGKSLADSTRTRGSTGPFTNGAAVSGRCFSCTLHFPPRS